jgi:hypothetical protein
MEHPWSRDRLNEHSTLVRERQASSAALLSCGEELLIVARNQLFLSRLLLEQRKAFKERNRTP